MKKKILIIYSKSTKEIFNRKSALGSYIFCLCEILQKNDMELYINGISFDLLKKQNYNTNIGKKINARGRKLYIPVFLKQILKDLLVFKSVRSLSAKLASSVQFDCVLEFYNYASDVGFKVANQQKIPLVVVYDAPVLEEHVFFHGNKYFFKKLILKRELKSLLFAKNIIIYSKAVENYLNRLTGKKLNVCIHQNVDFTRFDFIEKQFDKMPIKIGFIGSFLKWHRVDLLLKVFNRLRGENFNVELFLIGHGMEFDSIKALAAQSEYKEFITMPGFIDGDQLLEMKKQLLIGVMPGSNWYGAPNKIFEYGAAKMAVLAPSTPTIADLFEDKKDLLFFKQDNEDELYQMLKMLCGDLILSEQIAKNLQKKIKNKYSEHNTSQFYKSILNDAMSN